MENVAVIDRVILIPSGLSLTPFSFTVHAHNFEKYPRNLGSSFGKPYDYDSVMHYSKYAFSKDRRIPTIVPTDRKAVIGQRLGLSYEDREEINNLYHCKGEIKKKILFLSLSISAVGTGLKKMEWFNNGLSVFDFVRLKFHNITELAILSNRIFCFAIYAIFGGKMTSLGCPQK